MASILEMIFIVGWKRHWIVAFTVALSICCLYVAGMGYPIMGIPWVMGLLWLMVSMIERAQKRKASERMSNIVNEIFDGSSTETPDFILATGFRAPNVELIFKSQENIQKAQQDGTLQRFIERVRMDYSMRVFLARDHVTESFMK